MRCTAIPQFRSRRGEWNHPKNGDWEWVVGRVPSRGDTDAASSYAGSGDPATTLRDLPQPHPQGEPLDSCQSARLSFWEGPFVALEPSSTAVFRITAVGRHSRMVFPMCRLLRLGDGRAIIT
jgi:hypothetical protein